jgi:hypothetical protein
MLFIKMETLCGFDAYWTSEVIWDAELTDDDELNT